MARAAVVQLRLASLSAFTVVKLTSVLIEGDCYLNGGSWSGNASRLGGRSPCGDVWTAVAAVVVVAAAAVVVKVMLLWARRFFFW